MEVSGGMKQSQSYRSHTKTMDFQSLMFLELGVYALVVKKNHTCLFFRIFLINAHFYM